MFGGVLLQNNFLRSCWGNESVERGGGAGDNLYYLVAAAVGPNYSYAFVTVSPRLKTFLLELLTSLLTHCHAPCHTGVANQRACKDKGTGPGRHNVLQ